MFRVRPWILEASGQAAPQLQATESVSEPAEERSFDGQGKGNDGEVVRTVLSGDG